MSAAHTQLSQPRIREVMISPGMILCICIKLDDLLICLSVMVSH
jgi:hypothetical protein